MKLKDHYQLLGVFPTAPAEEIKHAFRREIARYHPDKVQHLGPEFQEIAATRAAQLTEAYRVLMNGTLRQRYDDALESGAHNQPAAPAHGPASPDARSGRPRVPGPRDPEARSPWRVDRRVLHTRATSMGFVRKAAAARLREALQDVAASAEPLIVAGFDAAYLVKPRKGLFRKSESQVRLLARFVPQVDVAAVEEAWPLAAKSGRFDGVICLMLFGTGVSSARELAAAVGEQRLRTRPRAPVVVPVDVRDWDALFPPGAPDIVRQVVQRLRAGP